MAIDYRIAVALAMTSNHGAVLGALSQHLLGVQTRVGQLTGGFNRLKIAIGGALAVGAGFEILDLMTKLIEKTKDYSEELVKLERLGGDMTKGVLSGEVAKRAFDISQRVPMKVTDLMKIPGATYSILGEKASMELWEDLAKYSFVLQSQKDYKGTPGDDLAKLIRAGELTGRLTDPVTSEAGQAQLKHFLDLMARITAATHGMVSADTMIGMAKQGGFTMRGLSDEGFYTQAIQAQAMGGPRAGTALLSMWQQLASGTMLKRSAEGLEAAGILQPGEWEVGKGGHVTISDAASKRMTGLVGKDPLDLANAFVEHFKKAGITDPEEQMRMVMRALGRQTTQRYTAEEVTNFHQMLAERERMKGGMGAEGSFGAIMGKSVEANLKALQVAWDNLLYAVAGPNSETIVKILQSLTGALNSMQAAVLSVNPETLRDIGIGLGILGVSLTGAGAVALLAALGPAGWVAGIAIGIGAALATFPKLREALFSIPTALNAAIDAAVAAINSLTSRIADAIVKFAQSLGGLFTNPTPKGGADGMPSLGSPMRFDHGISQPKATPIALSLNVDGRTLAQSISEQLEQLYEHATGSPNYNGQSHFGRADGGMSSS